MKTLKNFPAIAILSTLFFSLQLKAQESKIIQTNYTTNSLTALITLASVNSQETSNVNGAIVIPRSVRLNWNATKSTGISHFVIQRSEDGNDFVDAGIFMTDNSDDLKTPNYYFVDKIPADATGKVFYRLKQVQSNGDFEFIHVDAQGNAKKSVTNLVAINNKY